MKQVNTLYIDIYDITQCLYLVNIKEKMFSSEIYS
jgi:hypothetical protein